MAPCVAHLALCSTEISACSPGPGSLPAWQQACFRMVPLAACPFPAPCPPLLGQLQHPWDSTGKPCLSSCQNESHGAPFPTAAFSQALQAIRSCAVKRCHSGCREALTEKLCGATIHHGELVVAAGAVGRVTDCRAAVWGHRNPRSKAGKWSPHQFCAVGEGVLLRFSFLAPGDGSSRASPQSALWPYSCLSSCPRAETQLNCR